MNFKLYTLDEMIADIAIFEGIKVNLSEFSQFNIFFTRLYSSYFEEPLKGDEAKEQIKERLKTVLGNRNAMLIDVDKPPNSADAMTVYTRQLYLEEGKEKVRSVYLSGHLSRQGCLEAINQIEEQSFYVLDHETRFVMLLGKRQD